MLSWLERWLARKKGVRPGHVVLPAGPRAAWQALAEMATSCVHDRLSRAVVSLLASSRKGFKVSFADPQILQLKR
jgi:hypothetical protein